MSDNKIKENATDKINLNTLQGFDRIATSILLTVPQISLFNFNKINKEWERKKIEGSFFIYERKAIPSFAFFILNKLNFFENIQQLITKDFEFHPEPPYLSYKDSYAPPLALKFRSEVECNQAVHTLQSILEKTEFAEPNALFMSPHGATRVYRNKISDLKVISRLLPNVNKNNNSYLFTSATTTTANNNNNNNNDITNNEHNNNNHHIHNHNNNNNNNNNTNNTNNTNNNNNNTNNTNNTVTNYRDSSPPRENDSLKATSPPGLTQKLLNLHKLTSPNVRLPKSAITLTDLEHESDILVEDISTSIEFSLEETDCAARSDHSSIDKEEMRSNDTTSVTSDSDDLLSSKLQKLPSSFNSTNFISNTKPIDIITTNNSNSFKHSDNTSPFAFHNSYSTIKNYSPKTSLPLLTPNMINNSTPVLQRSFISKSPPYRNLPSPHLLLESTTDLYSNNNNSSSNTNNNNSSSSSSNNNNKNDNNNNDTTTTITTTNNYNNNNDIIKLSKIELQQSLCYLIQNDDEFMTKIHESYLKKCKNGKII